jgi:hypothetical protein
MKDTLFSNKMIHMADFVMENDKIIKMRGSGFPTNFQSELKILCEKYGIRANAVLIMYQEKDSTTVFKEMFFEMCRDKGLSYQETDRAWLKYLEICGLTWDQDTAREVVSSYT